MRHKSLFLAAFAAAWLLTAACDSLDKLTGKNPTSPGAATASLGDFAGTWVTSGTTFPATSCGGLKYTVTPVTSTSANVSFNATCAGNIQVNGTGSGTVSGSTLGWNAQGTVTQGSLSCPFTFTNGKATQDTASGGVHIIYSGSVCGIPVSGDEILKKPQ
jgi:Flp pilus assembly protein TadG